MVPLSYLGQYGGGRQTVVFAWDLTVVPPSSSVDHAAVPRGRLPKVTVGASARWLPRFDR